jgi:hypothetical protein
VIAYKFLKPDSPCRSGIHASRPEHLPLWAGQRLYEVELDGEIVEQQTKLAAARAADDR